MKIDGMWATTNAGMVPIGGLLRQKSFSGSFHYYLRIDVSDYNCYGIALGKRVSDDEILMLSLTSDSGSGDVPGRIFRTDNETVVEMLVG